MKDNLIVRTAGFAMAITKSYIRKGDTVIDATCGNGHDTLSLAEAAGPAGRVLAFDIQEQAVRSTRALLEENGIRQVEIFNESFTKMGEHTEPGTVRAVVFNLGYLPGGDKGITTKAEETVQALNEALHLLEEGGILTAVLYSGHPEGLREKNAALAWAEGLDSRAYHAAYISMINQKNAPPEILLVTKKSAPALRADT